MLSTNYSLKRLNLLKSRSKVEPMKLGGGNVSLDDLAFLVKRLSVQVDDLVEEKKVMVTTPIEQSPPTPQQCNDLPPLPLAIDTTRLNKATHTTIDPWASYVPQNYGALLQRLEDMESLQKCPNDCCASTGTVSCADGVPWPQPIEPFLNLRTSHMDTLDIQYTHWCTLMRCLPLMDPVTSAHVKTVGLYAMREILKSKASSQKKSLETHPACCLTTTTRLRDSMSCLSIPEHSHRVVAAAATLTATQDMPNWMSTSETKTALNEQQEIAPIPPPKETTTETPTPSGFPSPLRHVHTSNRFHKWVQYKKSKFKTNTDTATTPLDNKSQTLRRIGSWFF